MSRQHYPWYVANRAAKPILLYVPYVVGRGVGGVSAIVVAVLTLPHRSNAVRCHGTASNNSKVEEYLVRRISRGEPDYGTTRVES